LHAFTCYTAFCCHQAGRGAASKKPAAKSKRGKKKANDSDDDDIDDDDDEDFGSSSSSSSSKASSKSASNGGSGADAKFDWDSAKEKLCNSLVQVLEQGTVMQLWKMAAPEEGMYIYTL
jgi:hypothetical protein